MLIDCHTHLESYSEEEVSAVLDRAEAAGVRLVVSAGTTLDSSARSVDLSSQYSQLFSGVGVHPMDLCGPLDEEAYGRLRELATSSTKVLVVSEIGLDFTEGSPDRAIQFQALRQQIRLARELKLPIVFHSRDAHQETLRVLREERAYDVGGAMHYFQGDLDTARRAMDLGFHISLARPLLRLPHLQQVAAALPMASIVLESDAAPQHFKKKRQNWTEPRHVRDVAQKLADLHHTSLEEVATATSDNFLSLLTAGRGAVQSVLGAENRTLLSTGQGNQHEARQDQEAEEPAGDRG